MKLYILTSEAKNFVPVELAKKAQEIGLEAVIVDMAKTVLIEGTDSKVSYCECPKEGEEGEPRWFDLEEGSVIIPRLNEHQLEYKLGVLSRLTDCGYHLLNSAASMALCNDKLGSQVKLNTAGILTPKSACVGSAEMLDEALNRLEKLGVGFPMIIKTLRGTHGIGVMKVDSRASCVSVAQAFLAQGGEIMLQEFIEHDKSARLIMLGHEMLCANTRGQPKEKDEFRTNSHLGSETEYYEPGEEELALGSRIVELFGCNFCAIDYIIKDEKLIILEVNGSPGLEAIQKDWEGKKDLAKCVVEHCAKLMQPAHPEQGEQSVVQVVEPFDTHVEPRAAEPTQEPLSPQQDMLADIEPVMVHRISDTAFDARVDSGAAYCSLHADKVEEEEHFVKFKRGGVLYKVPVERWVKLRNSHGKSRRAIIRLDVELRGKRFNQIEFTVTSRSDMKYEALIGRNLLKLLGLPVIVNADGASYNPDTPESEIEVEEE